MSARCLTTAVGLRLVAAIATEIQAGFRFYS
jgi:hypothetical protein